MSRLLHTALLAISAAAALAAAAAACFLLAAYWNDRQCAVGYVAVPVGNSAVLLPLQKRLCPGDTLELPDPAPAPQPRAKRPLDA